MIQWHNAPGGSRMRTQHHLRKSTLLAFGAGTLPAAMSVVAASHLAWCRECRKAAAAAANTPDAPQRAKHAALPDGVAGHTALKARNIQTPAAAELAGEGPGDGLADFGLPMPLALHLDGHGLDDVAWRKILPGVAVRELKLPPGAAGCLRLVRIAPGKALPEHGHGGGELSLVLRGAYRDQLGRFTIGDIADLDGTAVHRPVVEDASPCICLVAAEMPVIYRSWFATVWQRLTGF
jgi:putative transcriptional regulator